MLNDGCSAQSVDSLYYGMYLLTRHYCKILAIVGSRFQAGIYRKFDLETLILKKQPKDIKLPGRC
jgi:hypothetical protein